MTTIVSTKSTEFVTVATGSTPDTSVVQQTSETVSTQSEGEVVVIEQPPSQTVVQSQLSTDILQVEVTSVETVSINSGVVGTADIINRQTFNVRAVNEFEVMISHDIHLEVGSEIVLNGTDGNTCGTLFLL